MKNLFARLIGNERGLTLPEYGIGLALAIGLGTAALGGLANQIGVTMVGGAELMPCTSTDPAAATAANTSC